MQITRRFLLGSVTGLLTITGAQAADMPVKAKPIQYVKICSAYGDGFYYIPGTDTCIKIGGFVRAEIDYNAAGSFTVFTNNSSAQFFRGGDMLTTRARAVVTFDVRENTEFGVLRSYLAIGGQYDSNSSPTLSLPGTGVPTGGGGAVAAAAPQGNNNFYMQRAFMQYAGFTIGKSVSFFDFFNETRYSYETEFLFRDTADVPINVFGYTQDLGNGFSVSGALEDGTPWSHPVHDLNSAPVAGAIGGAFAGNLFPILAAGGPTNAPWNNAGWLVPDLTFNARVDQAWGSAQIMFGLHQNRARYYQSGGPFAVGPAVNGLAYPEDKWGWAGGAGIEVNLPWAKGDSFAIQGQYCVGWSGRCFNNNGTFRSDQAFSLVNPGTISTIGLGWIDDAYMANTAATGATQLQLATMWNVYGAIQHYWTPWLRTSLYGGYVNYQANSSAVETLVCFPNGFGSGCADWAAWQIGSRTVWNPTKNLDVGAEVQWTQMTKTAFDGAVVTFSPTGHVPATFVVGKTGVLAAIFRVQRNFYP